MPEPKKPTPLSNLCAMTCNEGAFYVFLRDEKGWPYDNKEGAIDYIYLWCRIESRRELNTNKDAAEKWMQLNDEYQRWLRE